MKRLLTLLCIAAMLVTPVYAEEIETLPETDFGLEITEDAAEMPADDEFTEELFADDVFAEQLQGEELPADDEFDYEEGEIMLLSEGGFVERKFMPTNLFIIGATDSLAISWRNPASAELRSLKLYDITEGETELTGDEIEQEAWTPSVIKVTGLEQNKFYTFKIVSEFVNHAPTTFKFTTKTEGTSYQAISSWGRETYSSGPGYTPINPYIYTGDAHSGNACLRIVSNAKGWGNNYHTFMQSVELSSDKTYQFSFWAKGNYGSVSFYNHWTSFGGASGASLKNEDVGEWTQYVGTISNPASKTLRMNFEYAGDIFMIDDLEMYELDEEGNIVGDNLVGNSGFESGVDLSQTPEKIIEVNADTSVAEQVTLSWPPIADASAKINIYRKYGDEYVLTTICRNNENFVVLDDLTTDVENHLAIAIENAAYMESEMYELTVIPKSNPYVAKAITFTKGSTVLNELTFGRVTLNTEVKNNSMGDDFTAELIGVMYKDGILTNVFASGAVNIPQLPSTDPATKLTLNISAPTKSALESAEYRLEAFLWTSYEDMTVLSPYKVLTEN